MPPVVPLLLPRIRARKDLAANLAVEASRWIFVVSLSSVSNVLAMTEGSNSLLLLMPRQAVFGRERLATKQADEALPRVLCRHSAVRLDG